MPVYMGSDLRPKNNGRFHLMEDIYLKGGLQIRADIADRDSIMTASLKEGMFVFTMAERQLWQLESKADKKWVEFKTGGGSGGLGQRDTFIQVIDNLEVGGELDFDIQLAPSVIVYVLEVSRAVKVQVYGKADRSDPNPYTFLATDDHLIDDGTTKMSDGTVIPNRRYSIFANLDTPVTDKLYFRVSGVDQAAGPVALTLVFKPMEQL